MPLLSVTMRRFKTVGLRCALLLSVILNVIMLQIMWFKVDVVMKSQSSGRHPFGLELREANKGIDLLGSVIEDSKSIQTVKVENLTFPLEAADVFLSVKTSKAMHTKRIYLLLDTWYNWAPNQTYFFTDEDDKEFRGILGDHLVKTSCGKTHHREDLCCKTNAEYQGFMRSGNKWWCHMDDDVYLNLPELLILLRKYDSQQSWFLGKPSLPYRYKRVINGTMVFWRFPTGGAGYCISRGLAERMKPHMVGKNFVDNICTRNRLPDDMSMGLLMEHILGVNLTIIDGFHSHLEGHWIINSPKNQITFSFTFEPNVVAIGKPFSRAEDPTRFYSIHCNLNRKSPVCLNKKIWRVKQTR